MTARRWFVATAMVLAAFNVLRAVGLLGTSGVVQAAGLVAVLAVISWRARLDAAALGIARSDAGRGVAFGTAAFVVVLGVLLLVAVIPATSGFLDDNRADLSGPELIRTVVVSILLVTAIPEELAFRGVLLATARSGWDTRTAVITSSVLFGLWHIAPTLSTMSNNGELAPTTGVVARFGVIAANVAVTFVAGLLFCWLRLRSRSLVAPVLAHLATNGVALVVAWFVA